MLCLGFFRFKEPRVSYKIYATTKPRTFIFMPYNYFKVNISHTTSRDIYEHIWDEPHIKFENKRARAEGEA